MPWSYAPHLAALLYGDVAFKGYSIAGSYDNWNITADLEVPFFQTYSISPGPIPVGGTVYSWSYDPELGRLTYADFAFSTYAIAGTYTYWRGVSDPEVPMLYSAPDPIIPIIPSTYIPNTTYNWAYDPYLKNNLYSDFAFKSKATTGQVSFWKQIPDPEFPYLQRPIASVDPPYQEIGLNQIAVVSGANSLPTANNPAVVIEQWEWNWGDGTANSFGIIANHIYTVIGEYIGYLTVTDSLGQIDLIGFHVSVTNSQEYRVLYSISEGGHLACTFNDGGSWRVYSMRQNKAVTAPVIKGRSVAVDPDNRLIAYFGFEDGRIFKTEDGLVTVQDPIVDLGFYGDSVNAIEVEPFSGFYIYFGTESGKLYKSVSMKTQGPLAYDLIKDFDKRVRCLVISRIVSRTFIIGGTNLLSISSDNGVTWTDLDTSLDINNIEFSKEDSRVAFASGGGQIVKIDVPKKIISNRITDPGVLSVSTLAKIDGIISSKISHHFIRRAVPSSVVFQNTTELKSDIPWADIVLADRSNTDKWFFTYDNKVFKTYYNTYPQTVSEYTPTYQILFSYGKIKGLAQGSLVNSYDGFDWNFPTIPPIQWPGLPSPTFPPLGPDFTFPSFGPYGGTPNFGPLPGIDPPTTYFPNPPAFPTYFPIPDIPVGAFNPPDFTFDPPDFSGLDSDDFVSATKCYSGDPAGIVLGLISQHDTVIYVSDASLFSAGKVIKIEEEIMLIMSVTPSSITVQRGHYNSAIYAHYKIGSPLAQFLGKQPFTRASSSTSTNLILEGTAINETDTGFYLDTTDTVSVGQVIIIDTELMQITSISITGNHFIQVTRGYAGSPHMPHKGRTGVSGFDAFGPAIEIVDSVVISDDSKTVDGKKSTKVIFSPTTLADGKRAGLNIMTSGYVVSIGFFCYLELTNEWPRLSGEWGGDFDGTWFEGHTFGIATALNGFGCRANPIASVGLEDYGDLAVGADSLIPTLNPQASMFGYNQNPLSQYYYKNHEMLNSLITGSTYSFGDFPKDGWVWVSAIFALDTYTKIPFSTDDFADVMMTITDIYGNVKFNWDTLNTTWKGVKCLKGGAWQTRPSGGASRFAGFENNLSSIFFGPFLHLDTGAQTDGLSVAGYGWNNFVPHCNVWYNGITIRKGVAEFIPPPAIDPTKVKGNIA